MFKTFVSLLSGHAFYVDKASKNDFGYLPQTPNMNNS